MKEKATLRECKLWVEALVLLYEAGCTNETMAKVLHARINGGKEAGAAAVKRGVLEGQFDG